MSVEGIGDVISQIGYAPILEEFSKCEGVRWVVKTQYVCISLHIRCRAGVWLYAVLGIRGVLGGRCDGRETVCR